MKKIALMLLLIIVNTRVDAQAPFIQWQRCLGGSGEESAYAVQQTSDGGYVVVSQSASTDGDVTGNHGSFDVWVVKLSSWGSIVWEKCYGGSKDDVPNAVQQTADGGFIIGAYSRSTDGQVTGNHGNYDYWIVKLDDTGGLQWEHSFGGTQTEAVNAIQQTSDGGYIVGGWTTSNDGDVTGNHGGYDCWVLKLTATGAVTWSKTYGGSGDDLIGSIRQTTDGGYIFEANSSSTDGDVTGNHGNDDIWVVKLSSTGSIVWEKCYGGSGNDDDGDEAYPGSIQQTFDGGYIFSGQTNSTDGQVTGFHGGLEDYWVVKIDDTGRLVWENCYGGSLDDDGYFTQQTADSGYIVSGTSNSVDGDITHNYGYYDYWIIKLSASGSLLWQKNYGGSSGEYAFSIHPTTDSQYIVVGWTTSNDSEVSGYHGGDDTWAVKLAYCSLPAAGNISGDSIVCTGSDIVLSDNVSGGTWSADNSYGTISGGTVTGVSPGKEMILYSITNSCGTGGTSYTVTIDPDHPIIVATGDTLSTTIPYVTYQWTLNGTSIPGTTNATHVATANGVYSVTVTSVNGCSGTSGADTVRGLSISGFNGTMRISLVPNPTNGAVYVKGSHNVRIKVYNMLGQLVKQTNNADNISLSELPAGVYFFRLFDEQDNLILEDKIIKE